MSKKNKIITIYEQSVRIQKDDYISLTDIARFKKTDRTDDLIRNWLRNRNTVEYLGIWERLNNPAFKPVEFDGFRKEAGLNSFTLTPKQWIEKTGAIGITSKAGRYGGTYAHKDIAFEFATWISTEFKLYLIKEFQRLKEDEQKQLGWDIKRNLTKINYRIHTDAIKENLIPQHLGKKQIIPDIKIQQAIVTIYHTLETRKRIDEQLKASIKPLCPVLMRGVVEEMGL